jgi:RND family efflux transporter MFP subunit
MPFPRGHPRSLVLVLAACSTAPAASAAPPGPPPTPVKVAVAEERSLAPRKKVFGELRAARRTTVAAEEGGVVAELLVREGDEVGAGAPLARLDATRLRLSLASNRASLAAAEATVAEREASVALAERTLVLMTSASEAGATNPREMLDAESAVVVARAAAEQARRVAEVIRRDGELLSERIADLEVKAPFAGTVIARRCEIGGWVAEGAAVLELSETGRLEGWFDVPQELWGPARSAATAYESDDRGAAPPATVQTVTGESVPARGFRVIPEVDPRARTFHAVVEVANEAGAFAPGLALEAFVAQGEERPWTVVPKDALVWQGTSPIVYAVVDGKAMPVPVRVAFPFGDGVALEAGGLTAGATVVVEGNERLMPMAAVSTVPAGSPR